MNKPAFTRYKPTIVQNDLPKKFPKGFLSSFHYDFSITTDRSGIVMWIAYDIFKNKGDKKLALITKTHYQLTSDRHTDEEKYNAFFECVIHEVKEYRKSLQSLNLQGYASVMVIAPNPMKEEVLPVLRELFNPQSQFGHN